MLGQGSSPLVGTAAAFLGNITGANGNASSAGAFRVAINSYAQTTFYKTFLAATLSSNNATFATTLQAGFVHGYWKNTAAITAIVLNLGSGSFTAGSSFTLYGEQ